MSLAVACFRLSAFSGYLCFIGCLWFVGCTGKQASVATQGDAAGTAAKPASDPATDVLESALYQLKPENLSIDSAPDAAIAVLNSWREQTGLITVDKFGITAADANSLPAGLLTDPQRAGILATEFSNSDAFYIRNCLLIGEISRHVTESAADELARVVALFEFTMRNVTLPRGAIPRLPLFEVFRSGQGTPADRGWAFAALLKQQRIDSVILQSKSDPEQQLFGAIVDGQTYLFDTRLGLPIPRGDDPLSIRITRPATLAELQSHPDWWQALTVRSDRPYPWDAEQLAAADVLVYGEAESWSGRMKQLETVLPPASLCALYDPLFDTGAFRGVTHRIAAANQEWPQDRLRFWSYPLTAREEALKVREEIQGFTYRFHAPLEFTFSNETSTVMKDVKPTFQHARSRMEQLQGKYADATAHYLTVRHLMLEALPAAVQANQQFAQQLQLLYSSAIFDASYWTAVCKLEQGNLPAAANAFSDYLQRFPQSRWTTAARLQLMTVLAQQDKLADAQALGSQILPDDPDRDGLEVLLQRWSKLGKAETPAESKPEPAGVEKAP